MNIETKDIDRITQVFLKQLRKKKIRFHNEDNVKSWLINKIFWFERIFKKYTISDHTIKNDWIHYYDEEMN